MSEQIKTKDLLDKVAEIVDVAANTARVTERIRIVNYLLKHTKVCNYAAVNEEPCDVCSWAADTAKLIANGEPLDD